MNKTIMGDKINFNRKLCFALILALIMSLAPFSAGPVDADIEEPPISLIKINFKGMGGTVSPQSISVTPGGIYGKLPVPNKKYYQFKGWFTDEYYTEEITSGAIVTTASGVTVKTLYARWEGNEYKITLDPCRAKLTRTTFIVNYGEDFGKLPTPKRTGLKFMGWYTKKSGGKHIFSDARVSITKDTALYAKWAPIWYLQTDKRWKKKWYRVRRENSTIGGAGCGPTAMSMVVASIKNPNITPVHACKWSKKKKYKAYLSGTKDGFFKAYGKKNGIKVKQTYYGDLRYRKKSVAKKYHAQAKNAVENGNWVIVLAGKGKWTRGSGHFILWYKTEGDYAYIRDSNSKESGRAKAKVSTLQNQAKRYWIISVPSSKRVN